MKKHIISLLVLFLMVSSSFLGFSHPMPVPSKEVESLDDGPDCPSFLSNETPGIQWSRQYGAVGPDNFNKVRKSVDGGYLLVGYTKSFGPDGLMAAWLVKTDSMGYEEWNHTYSSFAVFGTDCQQTADGGYAFCGVNNESRFWLVKTDIQGFEEWNESYDSGTAWCFTQTTDGGYIISGYPEVVIKTDSQGNLLWKKSYLIPSSTWIVQISQATDGGFIAVGKTYHYSQTCPNGFLIKLDENGSEEWNHTYFKSVTSVLFSFAQTPDDGYLVAGSLNGTPWVVRTDQNGNELWNRTYTSFEGIIVDVVLLQDGGYALVGNDGSDNSFILAIDENGVEQWDITIDTYLLSLQQASDGGIVTAGNDESIDIMNNGILIKVGHVPQIEVLTPTNAVYLFGLKLFNFFLPVVIGKMTVEVSATDTQYSIERVEFLVDDVLQNTDTIAPYNWRWSTPSFFTHTVTVTAYNDVGNCSSQTLKVWKIF